MALGDYQESGLATSYQTGQNVPVHITAATEPATLRRLSLDVTTPDGAVINVKAAPGNPPQWLFDRAREPGLYTWKTSDARYSGAFAVNPPGDEAELFPADVNTLAKESTVAAGSDAGPRGPATIVARDMPELLRQLTLRGEGTTLMPGFLALVLILAVGEALLANRHRAE
jgi:hypothetical protein